MRSDTVCSAALISAGLPVGEVEVVRPAAAGGALLPGAADDGPVQGPFEPAAHLRGVLFGGRLVAGETGLQDPLTGEDAQARRGPGSALGHDDHSPLSALTS